MKRLRLGFLGLGLAGLMACGGRVIEQPGAGGADSGGPAPSGTAAASAGKSSSSGSLPTHNLGTCTPGFSRAENPGRPCHWLLESGLCFDDIDGACACVCPRSKDSVCFSTFDHGPSSATLVYCE
jgi:hypothetical protein